MQKIILWILILVLLLTAAGCALPRFPGDSFSAAPKPASNSEYATVYLYRLGTMPPPAIMTGIVKMYVDETSAFNAAHLSFTFILVKPGLREIKASWAWHDRPTMSEGYFDTDDKSITMNLEAGETYYISYRVTERRGSTIYENNTLIYSADLLQETMDVAVKEMEECGYLSNSYKP